MSIEDYPLRFPVVEVQQTFYQPPRDETMRGWLAATPAGFEFTLKAWQLVTHPGASPTYRRTTRPLSERERADAGFFRDTSIVAEGLARSLECARVLGATAMLFQCPASFVPDDTNIARLRSFFARIERPSNLRYLWEPRGAKWVERRALAHALADELAITHVIDPFVTQPERGRAVYFRLHGTTGARHVYSDAELKTLRTMVEGAPEPAYVMFNNLPRVGDAKRFLTLLAFIVCALVPLTARAQMNPPAAAPEEEKKPDPAKVADEKKEKEKALEPGEKIPETEKPNEEKRAEEEGKDTKLPSVAGRPVRRYAERNVLELGGSVSLVRANAFTQVGAVPTFGWFFIDYVQVSLLPSIEYVKTAKAPAKSRYAALIESSFHVHVVGPVFAFFGAGTGFVYEKETGAGLAIAPRLGMSLLIGGSGVLKLALTYVYTATKRTAIEDGSTDPHTSTFALQMGCTVAW
jgi:uncharacterized protein YecE (DUF72 family)